MTGRSTSWPGQRWAAPVAITAALLSACAYPTRNEALTDASRPRYDYQQARAADGMPDTLVIVTASGGGARATALALITRDDNGSRQVRQTLLGRRHHDYRINHRADKPDHPLQHRLWAERQERFRRSHAGGPPAA